MYKQIRKILFKFDPEEAHNVSFKTLNAVNHIAEPLLKRAFTPKPKISTKVTAFGHVFKNPVGLPAGFDKNANYVESLQHLGFGFLEVGSITKDPAKGNDKPRVFRILQDNAIVNRMGLNNDGLDVVLDRVKKVKHNVDIPIFINIAPTPNVHSTIHDVCWDVSGSIIRAFANNNIVVLNLSCPNANKHLSLFKFQNLKNILSFINDDLPSSYYNNLIVKLPHDLNNYVFSNIIDILEYNYIKGVIISNTSSRNRYSITGGYSGPLLKDNNLEKITKLKLVSKLTVIGCGGIQSPQDAQDYLNAGADLIQVGTGLIYKGPSLIKNIVEGISLSNA